MPNPDEDKIIPQKDLSILFEDGHPISVSITGESAKRIQEMMAQHSPMSAGYVGKVEYSSKQDDLAIEPRIVANSNKSMPSTYSVCDDGIDDLFYGWVAVESSIEDLDLIGPVFCYVPYYTNDESKEKAIARAEWIAAGLTYCDGMSIEDLQATIAHKNAQP